MATVSLFSLTSCSVVKENTEKVNSKIVMKIGDTEISRGDVVSAFYTYYQNNSTYFAYYDESVIENSFYQWFIVRQLVNDYAALALYDAVSNPNGFNGHITYYTVDDEKEVWKSVEDYFYSQVTSKEKIIYKYNSEYGDDEEKYPVWARTSEDEEEDSVFEPFTSSVTEVDKSKRTEENLRKKLTEAEVKSKVAELKANLFKFVPDENDKDDNDEPKKVDIDETNYIPGARQEAFIDYKADLVVSAKNAGTTTDPDEAFANEVVRIYEAYYNAKVSTLFQNYFLYEYLTDTQNGDANSLSDAAIAKAYITKYYADKQYYSSEQKYIEVMEAEDGATLLLYHFNGKHYYFSIQHILLKFPEFITNELNKIEENTSTDSQKDISDVYIQKREDLVSTYSGAVLTEVNTKNEFKSIALVGNKYYFEEEMKDLYGYYFKEVLTDGEKTTTNYIELTKNGSSYTRKDNSQAVSASDVIEVYGGYIKLSDATYNAQTNVLEYNPRPAADNYDDDELIIMASVSDVLSCYNGTYKLWNDLVEEYLEAVEAENTEKIETLEKEHDDIVYIFKMAVDMKTADPEDYETKLKEKIASMLFVQMEWVYSGDSLANELSNKIGYIVTNEKGDNGNWYTEFAVGGRELLATIESLSEADLENILLGKNGKSVSDLTSSVISDTGVHILKVDNIYKPGSSPVDIESLVTKYNGINYSNKDFVDEVIALLKNTYVSSASNETLYQYFYEMLYTNYVGSSSSNGTYFLAIEYEWLSSLYANNQIVYVSKLTYDDLMDTLS